MERTDDVQSENEKIVPFEQEAETQSTSYTIVAECKNDQMESDSNTETSSANESHNASLQRNPSITELENVELEEDLLGLICKDDITGLNSAIKALRKSIEANKAAGDMSNTEASILKYWYPLRLLQVACKLDSLACASFLLDGLPSVDEIDENHMTPLHHAADNHSVRCIEFLLQKRARTDTKSKKGHIPLESALHSKRMQVSWSPNDKVVDLLELIGEKDLTAIKLLTAHTKEVSQLACQFAICACIVPLAALLIVDGESFLTSLVNRTDRHAGGTLLDIIVKKAICLSEELRQKELSPAKWDLICLERQIILKELEIVLCWSPISSKAKNSSAISTIPVLIRAVQACDKALVKLLLDANANVNDSDSEGNTALHWCLKTASNTCDVRLIWQLLEHGASVTQGNVLGLTPVHIAARQGHYQALQILLAREPQSVHCSSETKETPLFYAVRNNQIECARLLLQYGAKRHVLNLRRQRPIDLAQMSDMRALLQLQESQTSGRIKEMTEQLMAEAGLAMGIAGRINEEEASNDLEVCKRSMLRIRDHASRRSVSPTSIRTMVPAKTEICRYYSSPGGCVRGEKCFFAHGEEELKKARGSGQLASKAKKYPLTIELAKKVFVGGLPPSVESDYLRDFFEKKFGPVLDAIVIGSHSGDHVQSRGFGFVTFKHEDSVTEAVESHYVNILGKKVEIKGAMPRSMLSIMSSESKDISIPSDHSFESSRWQIIQNEHKSSSQLTMPVSISSSDAISPPWLRKFKQWFPKFLAGVSSRLKDGEWYPLSSLKGDFRATCGMELDHVPLGYHKLSDFVRSLPDVCKMKIVPVGRGPATHMVLHQQAHKCTYSPTVKTRNISRSALVSSGRSYAAAAVQGVSKHTTTTTSIKEFDADEFPPLEARAVNNQGTPSDISGVFSTPIGIDDSNLTRTPAFANGFPKPLGFQTSSVHEDLNYLTELLSLLNRNEDRVERSMPVSSPVMSSAMNMPISSPLTNNALNISSPLINGAFQMRPYTTSYMTPPHYSDPRLEATSRAFGTPLQQEPRTPANQIPVMPFTAFNNSFAGFLQQDNSFYSQAFTLGRGMESNNSKAVASEAAKQYSNMHIWQKSPQSILSPYEVSDDDSPSPSSYKDKNQIGQSETLCSSCLERQAVWVAVPCGHRVFCSLCMDVLQKRQSFVVQQCLLCRSYAENWIAFH